MSYKSSLGIALSGGGIRGIAHLGVLKAFDEYGISPKKVSGTSAGAIVGALYCQGYSPEEIMKIIHETNYFRLLRPAISWKGLFRIETLVDVFKDFFPHNSFSKLSIPCLWPPLI